MAIVQIRGVSFTTVTVYTSASSGVLATVYSDISGATPHDNPFPCYGNYTIYVDGPYYITHGDFTRLVDGSGSSSTNVVIGFPGYGDSSDGGGDGDPIPGPPGPAGAAGAAGATGAQGPAGPAGADGDSGEDGIGWPGPPGPQGPAGSVGAAGVAGLSGPPGYDGEDGQDGIGWPGSPGAAGATGATGAQGLVGPAGIPGEDGQDGQDSFIPGPIGPQGIQGSTGPIGLTGIGIPGQDGADGEDGIPIPGPVGLQGTQGIQGLRGQIGIGIPGEDGQDGESSFIPGPVGPQGPAGGGGGSATTVEQNLGSTAIWRGTFTITDAAITAAKKIMIWQAPGPYTGKGTRADEAEMVRLTAFAEPLSGSAKVYWETLPMTTNESMEKNQQAITASIVGLAGIILPQRRINKVRGNVKFTYMVLS